VLPPPPARTCSRLLPPGRAPASSRQDLLTQADTNHSSPGSPETVAPRHRWKLQLISIAMDTAAHRHHWTLHSSASPDTAARRTPELVSVAGHHSSPDTIAHQRRRTSQLIGIVGQRSSSASSHTSAHRTPRLIGIAEHRSSSASPDTSSSASLDTAARQRCQTPPHPPRWTLI
jgi:hypothetical protein